MDGGDCWDFLDYSFIGGDQPADFLWSNQSIMDIDLSGGAAAAGGNDVDGDGDGDVASEVKEEKECPRKRGRTESCSKQGSESCSKQGSKACREKLRRERLNDRHATH